MTSEGGYLSLHFEGREDSLRLLRLEAALRRMIAACDLEDDLKEAYDEAKALLAEPATGPAGSRGEG